MTPRDIFIDAVSNDILELVAVADTLDHSDLTGQAMAIAMAAWSRAGERQNLTPPHHSAS